MIFVFNDLKEERRNIESALNRNGLEAESYSSPLELWEEHLSDLTQQRFVNYIAWASTLVITDYEMGKSNRDRLPSFYLAEQVALTQRNLGYPVCHFAFYSGYENPPFNYRYKSLPENSRWYCSHDFCPYQLVLAVKNLIVPEHD